MREKALLLDAAIELPALAVDITDPEDTPDASLDVTDKSLDNISDSVETDIAILVSVFDMMLTSLLVF
jgi:hypothetical protein